MKHAKLLPVLPVIADGNKPLLAKDVFNDKGPETCPDANNHRKFLHFNDLDSIEEETSYPDDMLNGNVDVFSGPKDIIPVQECTKGPNES